MESLPWTVESQNQAINITISLDVYPLEVVFRTSYRFTDRCYLFLQRDGDGSKVTVNIARKRPADELADLAGEFCNELINQRVRLDVSAETKPLRELIVAQAFAEADLLDRSMSEADYHEDPRRIAK